MSETRTFRDAVAREFILRRGEWIDGLEYRYAPTSLLELA